MRDAKTKSWSSVFAVVLFAAVGVLASSTAAAFPSEEPLPVSLVNGADSVGEPVAEKLRKILRSQDELNYVEQKDLIAAGASHGVTVETLRKGSMRERHAEEFQRTMSDAGVETILVLDVFGGKAQIVAIGPRGHEVSDERRRMSGDNLKTKDAAELLKASFDRVVPEWKAWKRGEDSPSTKRSKAQASKKQDDTSDSGDSDSSDESDETAASESDVGIEDTSVATIDPGMEVWMGGVAGRHSLDVSTPEGYDYSISQANPFLGAKFELSAVLGRFADRTSGFGLDVFGIYAPFSTALGDQQAGDGNAPEYSSSISQLGVDLKYLNQLNGRFRVDAGTGFEVLSLRIEKNEKYTGNRYAQFRFTGGLTYRPFSVLSARVGGGLAPVLRSDMSGGAFGESAFSPGVLGEGELRLLPFDPVIVSLGYQLYYYDLVFRDPNIIETRADVTDVYQIGSLKLSYRF